MSGILRIQGAREHNLKNISIDLPKDSLVVISGLSGSGKSSLAFDTIFAEGQRRYMESLSSYARQFLGRMEKPEVDNIEGLSPAIAIEQKSTNKNPRSTVGTITEIYDYYRLLWARIGHVHCPDCGRPLSEMSIDQIIDRIYAHEEGGRLIIGAPVALGRKGEYRKTFEDALASGYTRAYVDGVMFDLSEQIPKLEKNIKHEITIVVDRLLNKNENRVRLADSIEHALEISNGLVEVLYPLEDNLKELYSERSSCPHCGTTMPELEPRLFSFNNPYGACPACNGLGESSAFDPQKIIPNPKLSFNQGAIVTHKPEAKWSLSRFQALARAYNFSLDTPIEELDKRIVDLMLYGSKKPIEIEYVNGKKTAHYQMKEPFEGVIPELNRRYATTQSLAMRIWLDSLKSWHECKTCHGARLRREALAVTVGEKNIMQVTDLSVRDSLAFFENLELTETEEAIAHQILKEIKSRLTFLRDVGLSYLTLSRSSRTLSGGEAQRIRLATQIGSSLSGVLYVLDEPSIGLHQRDNQRLIDTLIKLRNLGNTVLVVEHDEDTIRQADYVVDLGPGAGEHGGEIIAKGTPGEIAQNPDSITGQFLSGALTIDVPRRRNPGNGMSISISGVKKNNLKNISVDIPLGEFVVITGVSGSGKSTLLNEVLLPAVKARLNKEKEDNPAYDALTGLEYIDKVINIDQSPIGRTPRSNPATYVGVFTPIRELFASMNESKARGFSAGRFSFNVPGGRCENCQGDGTLKIEMHFLPDVFVPCDVCHGKRFNKETLAVTYKGKNIADVLDMTITEAYELFAAIPAISRKLKTLIDVGLGYIRLGQSSLTLSGGEAQRVKLALELSKIGTGNTLYILDEPTTGLHFADVKKLLEVLQLLRDQGNTVVLIEHNLDVIKCADHIIDLGPEGGDGGGRVVVSGTPEQVALCKNSYTGYYLKKYLNEKK
jgi:excinuclease ABC, A subunit